MTKNILVSASPICQGTIYEASINSPQSGVTYTWSANPAIMVDFLTPTGTSVYFEVTLTGLSQSVQLIATPSNTCGSGTAGTLNLFTYKPGDHLGCDGGIFLREAGSSGFAILTDPLTRIATVQYQEASEVNLVDLSGKTVVRQRLDPSRKRDKLDLTHLAKGLYIVKFLDKQNQPLWTDKMVL
ncbi:MAG: T9SS type A sorting domain-containing protein [Bacteroidota bacterium]